ncbi:MAG: transketolase family protein [Candidatus Krumholzibacteria bacterium]|jgi:transketolase|nr:transketolase family protein [Candidatus Krumholzibacteria bacterium]MDP6669396.1 transketolase family protein [Candidatus Krumholzibacteria bacterium]MDP6797956.1 transketolase family protein [Candidatus Krumholzibacteria bacterium]MDP7021889.1 transketolase family protein [Candidatus Krumholzibacteria bacterium]
MKDFWKGYQGKDWELTLPRESFGRTLVALGKENPRIVVLDADLSASTLTKYFHAEFPERSFDMGIAEQDLVGTAAGLAATGFIPFCSTYAMFLAGRAWEQIRNAVAYSGWNVKLAAAHGGISVGKDGPTHQSMEDIALMRSIPGMTVIVPADAHETARLVRWAADYDGPVYFRMGREKVPVVTSEDDLFEHGKAMTLREGDDATIIAAGLLVSKALEAAELLEKDGISARVLNMHTIKPIDRDAIAKASRETGVIVTAEEHNLHGGLGDAVAQVAVQEERPPRMRYVAVQDRYMDSGPPEELMELAGLTAENIARQVHSALASGSKAAPLGGERTS